MIPAPHRPAACYSDLTLDRLLVGELDGDQQGEAVRAHLSVCATCRARLSELEWAQGHPPEERSAVVQSSRGSARRVRARLVGLGMLAATAAAVLLLVRRPAPPSVDQSVEDGVQVKGAALGLDVIVRRKADGRTGRVAPGEVLHPGDALRFRVRTPRSGFVVVLSREANGTWSQFAPGAGDALPVTGPGDSTFDGSVELDESLGPEQLVTVLCSSRAAAVAALDVARARASSPGDAPARLPLAAECSHTVLPYSKAPSP
jgi:hypothetical protein